MSITHVAPPLPRRSAWRFTRHYLEMVVAMLLGMVVLGVPAEALLGLAGVTSTELHDSAPEVALLYMCFSMTVPMVWWMRRAGHAWRPCHEMTASMVLPTLAVIVLLRTGAIDGFGAAMGWEHVLMLPSMLVAMLLRVDEYAGDHCHAGARHGR